MWLYVKVYIKRNARVFAHGRVDNSESFAFTGLKTKLRKTYTTCKIIEPNTAYMKPGYGDTPNRHLDLLVWVILGVGA